VAHFFIRELLWAQIIVLVEEQTGTGTAQPELQGLLSQTHSLYVNAVRF
jgi:hypothetical protein